MTSDQPMDLDYKGIFRRLNELEIDYILVGGLAVNFHGVPRMTYDIDIIISLQRENILRLVSQLGEWGYEPKIPIEPVDLADPPKRAAWIKDKGLKAVDFHNTKLAIAEVDVLIDSPLTFAELKGRAVKISLEGVLVPTVSIHDLIQLKLTAGRKQDLADVEHLRRALDK